MLPESSENSMKTGVTPLPCNLLAVGDAAARSLPLVLTALSCGAARPVSSLSVFALCPGSSVSSRPDFSEIESLASSFSAQPLFRDLFVLYFLFNHYLGRNKRSTGIKLF